MIRLSPAGLERMTAHQMEADGLAALAELAELLDPGGRRGRWELAGLVSQRLRRFEGGPVQRIRRGARPPRDPAERALAAIASSNLPRSRRKIWDLLA